MFFNLGRRNNKKRILELTDMFIKHPYTLETITKDEYIKELEAYRMIYNIFHCYLYFYEKNTSEYIKIDKVLDLLQQIKEEELKERGLK